MTSQFRSALKDNLGLYVITTEAHGRSHIDIAEAAIAGGASFIQYRDKRSTNRELYEIAKQLRVLTRQAGVKFIINDRTDLALAVDADGVHLGDDDFPYEVTREMLGQNRIIGISTTCIEEAMAAQEIGADYIGVGPVYDTTSKACAVGPIGIDGVWGIREAVSLPMVAIGGISVDTCGTVMRAQPDGIAVISAVSSADNMVAATRTLSGIVRSSMLT
ncbi:MAG: thiamine phosphate synthase [Candidatus Aquicultor sp.]